MINNVSYFLKKANESVYFQKIQTHLQKHTNFIFRDTV